MAGERSLSFKVIGIPKAQARPRFDRRSGRAYESGTSAEWKNRVYAAALYAKLPTPLTGPIRFDLTIWMPRPKSHYRSNGLLKPSAGYWHDKKPDRDNLEKAIKDALTEAQVWDDDARVCCGETMKVWADGDAGALIEIDAIAAHEPQEADRERE